MNRWLLAAITVNLLSALSNAWMLSKWRGRLRAVDRREETLDVAFKDFARRVLSGHVWVTSQDDDNTAGFLCIEPHGDGLLITIRAPKPDEPQIH